MKLSKSLPMYDVEEISRVLALGILLGYDKLSKEDSEMIDRIANGLFVLDNKIGGDEK